MCIQSNIHNIQINCVCYKILNFKGCILIFLKGSHNQNQVKSSIRNKKEMGGGGGGMGGICFYFIY